MTRRATRAGDGRVTAGLKPPPPGIHVVDRETAARLAGTTVRTLTRWARAGKVNRYQHPSLGVVFDAREMTRAARTKWTHWHRRGSGGKETVPLHDRPSR